jgi:CubicO group peptidase (beta-lactamase class C family)
VCKIKVTEGHGLTFEQIIERDIFGPLDMTHSFYDPSSMKESIVVPKNESRQDIISVDYDVNIFNAYAL